MNAILELNAVLELVIGCFILIGALFALTGSFGLARLPDFFTRLHAPTKATTLGIGSMLVASTLHFTSRGEGISAHELLISLFLFITAPITAHMLAKAALHHRLKVVPQTRGQAAAERNRDA